ncbi:MAG: hypothetical protein GTO45_08025 [Candidatus Aminicenantes bacterium]|nr:hypothetical protein [Candidatus Aminicenantes bacterium]NIM78778.1 hypothetical protein [Candidatus Aminicenantes bacterium]NIN18033.1 hypothetical protein [Candidatus Aminicenantes bacterium]NIN41933.1 hypothetical protein [Candidatus Aminicenantes bacterium]NIN84688.1 hypothetical protein [Candidatus Aminicenantes bacterium]
MNKIELNIPLLDQKADLEELERTLFFDEFLDASEKSTRFLKYFYDNCHEYDWAYTFIIPRSKKPRLLTYQPLTMIERILYFNSRINIQSVVEVGCGYDFLFSFDKSKNELFIKEEKNDYFFFPVFHDSRVDPIDYCRQEIPTAGFIFHNSTGFLREQMYEYEDFRTLVRISNLVYRDILLESITPSSILFLKESVRNLERIDAPPKIIQDFLLRALQVGRTQWNWDILGNALIEILDKVELPNAQNGRYLRKLSEFLRNLLDDLDDVQNFAKVYVKACEENNNLQKSSEEVLRETFENAADDNLKFLYHTRSFLKEFRVEYLNLSQVGAVAPQQVLIKSKEKNCLTDDIERLVEETLKINRILFEFKYKD